ncbi:MAG: integrase [Desulfotomaculum sp. BICA1-6]|nr:MAG: integrase [Desulfotomaculum sp. BICA1-6]
MARQRVLRLKKDYPVTWEDALEQFLRRKMAEGLSPTTIHDYSKHIKRFFNYFPDAFDASCLKDCVMEHMSQKIKPATYNLRLIYLKTFFTWCLMEGIFPSNPLEGLKKRKDPGRIVNIDADVLTELITLPNKNTYAGFRDYTLILLSLDTGIRPKEAFSIMKEDINFRSLEIYVRSEVAKTRTSRTLPISPVTAKAITDLISSRHHSWKEIIPVFCSCEGTPLNRHTWGQRLKVYSKQLEVKVRPYDLRHAFALQYLRNGGNALALQRTMGHSDLTMTKRYVALTQQDLREQHATASPLNVLLPQKNRIRKIK